ncbi:MAG: LptF/LptG family permease [Gemmataceae bacterium]|nr:LptF/LptG family permease [Gemmataceae bacterium]MDW8267290.1 LptF/LptG family permease [Gemmataceae bacterium]
MTLFDRLLIRAYFKSYAIWLVCLLSLYVVVDLFTNIGDFLQYNSTFAGVLRHVGSYYGYRTFAIFDRLNEGIALLAAMFTVAWMQRHNELLPFLSAGVSTRRVILPVLVAACLMLLLATLNQELIIPNIAAELSRSRDDPEGNKDLTMPWAYQYNGIHIEGVFASKKNRIVRPFFLTIPEGVATGLVHLKAAQAEYIPPGAGPLSGGWLLTDAEPRTLEGWNNPEVLEMIDPGKYFLHTSELDIERISRRGKWYVLASTYRLYQEVTKAEAMRIVPIAVLFHLRLVRPLLGILLVVLGLSVILRDQNRNVFISAALCLLMCAIFFAVCFASKFLGDNSLLPPALAAWLPVLIFGPPTFVLYDAIHT